MSESEVQDSALDRAVRDHSRLLSAIHLAVSAVCVVTFILMTAVFFLSSSTQLSWDRRAVLCGVVGVVLLSSLGLLFLARKESRMLTVLSVVVAYITGLTLGLCIWYL